MGLKIGDILLVGGVILMAGLGASLIGSQLYSSQNTANRTSEVSSPTGEVHFSSDEFEVLWQTSEGLFNPYRLQLYSGLLVVRDADADAPFLKFDTTGHFQDQFGGWGEGPGEFGKQPRLAGRLSSTHLALSDDMRRRVMRFDLRKGAYDGEMQVPASGGPPVIDGSLLVVRPSQPEHFLEGFRIDPSQPAIYDAAPISFGTYDELPEVASAKDNYLLKQGPMYVEPAGPLYLALRYAGFLMSFRRDGSLRFKTSEPLDIPLPDFSADDIPIPGVTAASPPGNMYPKVFIGLSVGDKRIYALYSGKKHTERVDITELDQGTRVYAYDKNTGDLAFSFALPIPVRDLVVTSDAIYALSVDPEVALLKLSHSF